MREVVICEPVRTPIGRYGGMFKNVTAVDLGAQALTGLLERTGLDPSEVDDVVLGHCNGNSEAPAIGRVVALDAGLPVTVPGQHLDRRCGSGLQSVVNAVMGVLSGAQDLVLAGGVESMSNAVFYSTDMRWGGARSGITVHDGLVRARETAGGSHYPVPGGMIETAEHPRADTSVETLSGLEPIMRSQDPDATVTAGNASGQNDAAALCVVTTRDKAEALGLRPLVRLVTWAVAGVQPGVMGIGPVPASASALERAGLTLADMDRIELNEAFAAQALAVMREWGFTDKDRERTNVHGSGISLGHPVGATGTRMVGTLARELDRAGGRYGLATMCIGGGQGLAAVFESASVG